MEGFFTAIPLQIFSVFLSPKEIIILFALLTSKVGKKIIICVQNEVFLPNNITTHKMTILLLGSGGREHAPAWKMLQSSKCTSLFVAPGNAGTATIAKNVALNPNDFEAVKTFVLQEKVEMVVVGPEDPLVLGIYDFFKNDSEINHIPVIGPSKVG